MLWRDYDYDEADFGDGNAAAAADDDAVIELVLRYLTSTSLIQHRPYR